MRPDRGLLAGLGVVGLAALLLLLFLLQGSPAAPPPPPPEPAPEQAPPPVEPPPPPGKPAAPVTPVEPPPPPPPAVAILLVTGMGEPAPSLLRIRRGTEEEVVSSSLDAEGRCRIELPGLVAGTELEVAAAGGVPAAVVLAGDPPSALAVLNAHARLVVGDSAQTGQKFEIRFHESWPACTRVARDGKAVNSRKIGLDGGVSEEQVAGSVVERIPGPDGGQRVRITGTGE